MTGNGTENATYGQEQPIISGVPSGLNRTNASVNNTANKASSNKTSNKTSDKKTNQTVNETVDKVLERDSGENVSGILFGNNTYILVLEDVVPVGEEDCAAIAITYADGTLIKRDLICPRSDYYWTAPNGERFRINMWGSAIGYSGGVSSEAVINKR